MKLKALFVAATLALVSMSFSSNNSKEQDSIAPDNTCQGSEYVCTASPGKYWK